MIAELTSDRFVDLCRKSGLIPVQPFNTFLRSIPSCNDARLLASRLIREGLLTRYQAAQLLLGKYRGFTFNGLKILDPLGHGGMGTVYLCEQVNLRRKVAIKILPEKQSQEKIVRERFFREARAVASLDHPNIVRVFDCVTSADLHYILMEYVEGRDLQALLDREKKLCVEDAVNYIVQAAAGLDHAHRRGLVHRDVKPSNLMLDVTGTIRILDLGLARFFADPEDDLTQKFDRGAVVGTIDFISPEQAIESSAVDARADIYSLGVTLYTLLSGKPPFEGTTSQKLLNHQIASPPPLHELHGNVPPRLNAIVQKMMAKNPDGRYGSAGEVISELAPYVSTPTFRASSTTTRISPSAARLGTDRALVRSPVVTALDWDQVLKRLAVIGGIGLSVVATAALLRLTIG